jgi:hypothetical protein
VLAEKLDGAIARPVNADLRAGQQPVPELEADLGAVIESKEIRQQIAEVPLAQRAREPVRYAER